MKIKLTKLSRQLVSLVLCMIMTVGIIPAYAADTVDPHDFNMNEVLEQYNTCIKNVAAGASHENALSIGAGFTYDTTNIESAIKIIPTQEALTSESGSISSQEYNGPMIVGELPTPESSRTHMVEIDHSILPGVILYAFCYGATGDVKITVTDSDGNKVAGVSLVGHSTGTMARYWPKGTTSMRDDSGAVVTYAITVTTSTGNAAYGINLGTRETIVESYGGANFATVAKNVPSDTVANVEMTSSFPGTATLLNTGEWFHYTADGDTFITATKVDCDKLAFFIVDPETSSIVYETNSDNRCKYDDIGTAYVGCVSSYLALEAGKDYLICFYVTDPIEEVWGDYYYVHIGLPEMYSESMNYCTPTSYTIPANTTKTFTFTIDEFPTSAVAGQTAYVAFNTPKTVDNVCITSLVVTAPNGQSYVASPSGICRDFHYDSRDFFSPDNVRLNGTWTVRIRTSQTISGLQFKMYGYYKRIPGQIGD